MSDSHIQIRLYRADGSAHWSESQGHDRADGPDVGTGLLPDETSASKWTFEATRRWTRIANGLSLRSIPECVP
jgi:hypothetical protein